MRTHTGNTLFSFFLFESQKNGWRNDSYYFLLLQKVNAHSDAPGRVAIRDSPGRTSWPVTSEHIRVKSGSPAPCAKRNLHDQITSGNFVN
jgi:hypothetical protein